MINDAPDQILDHIDPLNKAIKMHLFRPEWPFAIAVSDVSPTTVASQGSSIGSKVPN